MMDSYYDISVRPVVLDSKGERLSPWYGPFDTKEEVVTRLNEIGEPENCIVSRYHAKTNLWFQVYPGDAFLMIFKTGLDNDVR
jgi:hypothetical protein